MTKRTPVCLWWWLPGRTLLSLGMSIEDRHADAFLAAFALFEVFFLVALLYQVSIQVLYFNDLTASIAIGQHETVDNVVQVKLFWVSKLLLLFSAELARWNLGLRWLRWQLDFCWLLLCAVCWFLVWWRRLNQWVRSQIKRCLRPWLLRSS